MQIIGVREAHARLTSLLHLKEPTIIARHGKEWIATILPAPSKNLPIEVKKEIFQTLSHSFEKHLKKKKIKWENLLREMKE